MIKTVRSKKSNSLTPYRGVSLNKSNGKFRARLDFVTKDKQGNKKTIHIALGTYDTCKKAYEARKTYLLNLID